MKLNSPVMHLVVKVSSLFGQTDKRYRRIKVLKKNIIGKEFTIGKWDEENATETRLK